MARQNFPGALRAVLAHEGGYVNDPQDPGGATNKGVTQRVYDAYRRRQQQPARSVRGITSDEVSDIYKRQYWDVVRGDDLPSGIDYAVFDYAVNSGPSKAAKDLQRVLGVSVDGVVGQVTLRATETHSARVVVDMLCDRRMAFLKRLKHWPRFKNGWTRRVADVRHDAKGLAIASSHREGPIPMPPPKPSGGDAKASPKDVAATKTPEGVGGGIAGVGGAGTVIVETAEKMSPFTDYSDWIKYAFVALMLIGVGITVYALLKKRKEGGME